MRGLCQEVWTHAPPASIPFFRASDLSRVIRLLLMAVSY